MTCQKPKSRTGDLTDDRRNCGSLNPDAELREGFKIAGVLAIQNCGSLSPDAELREGFKIAGVLALLQNCGKESEAPSPETDR
jgi:hypothetical protein